MATTPSSCWRCGIRRWSFHVRPTYHSYPKIRETYLLTSNPNVFRFGWTGFTKSVHWMVPTSSGVLNGFGMYTIFLQCFNYLIDSYPELCDPRPLNSNERGTCANSEFIVLHRLWQEILSSDPALELLSHCSRARCINLLEYNGLVQF